ncbi:MAG TPA: stalk domain-containing protein [Clostridia bacterium]
MNIFLYQKNKISSKYVKIMKNTFVLTILFGLGIIGPNLIKAQTVYAADQTIKVSCNYKELKFDQEPIVKDGRVLVPIRKIFEALGSKVA